MARVLKAVVTPAKAAPEEREYKLDRETKGCWVYMWSNPKEQTEDWARKWYVLKRDYPVCPGNTLKVTIAPV
jgi:hypothetical protein